MPLPTLAETKDFNRVDGDFFDAQLQKLMDAATEYVETATGLDLTSTEAVVPERAGVVIMSLAGHWYDNRLPVAEAVNVVPFHVRSLIHQLRNWEDPAVTEALAEEDPAP